MSSITQSFPVFFGLPLPLAPAICNSVLTNGKSQMACDAFNQSIRLLLQNRTCLQQITIGKKKNEQKNKYTLNHNEANG